MQNGVFSKIKNFLTKPKKHLGKRPKNESKKFKLIFMISSDMILKNNVKKRARNKGVKLWTNTHKLNKERQCLKTSRYSLNLTSWKKVMNVLLLAAGQQCHRASRYWAGHTTYELYTVRGGSSVKYLPQKHERWDKDKERTSLKNKTENSQEIRKYNKVDSSCRAEASWCTHMYEHTHTVKKILLLYNFVCYSTRQKQKQNDTRG